MEKLNSTKNYTPDEIEQKITQSKEKLAKIEEQLLKTKESIANIKKEIKSKNAQIKSKKETFEQAFNIHLTIEKLSVNLEQFEKTLRTLKTKHATEQKRYNKFCALQLIKSPTKNL